MAITSYYKRLKRKNDIKRFFRDRENRRAVTRILLVSIVVVILAVAASLFFIYRSSGGSREPDSRVLTVAKAPESQATCITSPDSIPDYSGKDTIELNGNVPNFTEYDLENIEGELFSPLDRLGRCGTAIALLDRSMMSAEERGNIGMIRPSGWHTVRYDDLIEDKYLYNRCHLIAYAMTGQNSNELNLITGTRYLNTSGMLPFEIQVLQYLDGTDNHVLYRVTPFFKGNELVARGVEMEAWSVEDHGKGVCFHVFVYNQQPGVVIDYSTGDSHAE